MAKNQERVKPKEREIPVFAVLKNNCILKNIFLLDKPPSISSSSSVAENGDEELEIEEILVVGRHPDCNIKLEHPSISRFHLRIHSKPSSLSLFVTDLSSVHGTWISGKRVEPGVRMKLNEGDTLHLGASSRLYRLHWVPLSRAYDIDNPFVPQLDAAEPAKEEEEEEGTIYQDENSLSCSNDRMQTMNDNCEGLELLFIDEDQCTSMAKMSPVASIMLEEEVEKDSSVGVYDQENGLSSPKLFHFEKESSTPPRLSPEVYQSVSQLETTEISGVNSEKKSVSSIWSRRGKKDSVKIEMGQSGRRCGRINMIPLLYDNHKSELVLEDHYASPDNNEQVFTPDKENTYKEQIFSPDKENTYKEQIFTTDKENMSQKTPVCSVDQDEEIFTPDKENMTPNSNLIRSTKNMENYRSSPLKRANNSNMYQEEAILHAVDNPEVLQERRSRNSAFESHVSSKKEVAVLNARADRDPFRPLPLNSTSNNEANSKPLSHEDTTVNHSHRNTMKVEKNRWIIVVDTACLLNKKSRKELQLLRGLKGTSLIIPRIVVRELDFMQRRGSFFTRNTEVSAALQWIQESMAVATWWIHVQTSAEEGRLIPPTPPASPHWFSDGKGPFSVGSRPFSPHNLQEIVTPTTADHILECALLFKRTKNEGQLVLLSDDVALKIKAMAEGVICETAEEFRKSLVNPFSSRFLYSNSSPLGPTWSCVDDTVLKEEYYLSPCKKVSKSGEGVKGLKLILLHNSNFRQIPPVS